MVCLPFELRNRETAADSRASATRGRHINKDADLDCSGAIAGTLLLFTFTKKASIVVNFDNDISLGSCHCALAPQHPGHGTVSSNEGANG